MSKPFNVEVREVHVSTRVVAAENAEEAIQKIQDGEGTELSSEYSHTLDTETWVTREA